MFSRLRFSLSTQSRILLILGCILIFSMIATATCPVSNNKPRWRWNEIEYTYDGSGSTSSLLEAIRDWNGVLSGLGFTTINPAGFYNDIQMHDGMLDPDNQAETIVWGEDVSFICTNKKDNTYNYCYNSAMAYFSETKFDQTQIASFGSAHGVSDSSLMFRRVAAHEFGHILDLHDVTDAVDCSSSGVTIMNRFDTGAIGSGGCGINGPQTCDSNTVSSVYSGWSTYTFNGGCDTNVNC